MLKIWILAGLILSASLCYGADCEPALFGWDTATLHVRGILANEGVSKRNPRGYQDMRGDSGNRRNGKDCGGTAFGLACADHPNLNMRTVTKDQAVKAYHDYEWTVIRGDSTISQYIAYKSMDLAVNKGAGEAEILLSDNARDLGWTGKGHRLTNDYVTWLNEFTKTKENRIIWVLNIKIKMLMRDLTVIGNNSKDAQFAKNWEIRDGDDL